MFFKLAVVFALVGMAAASLSPEEQFVWEQLLYHENQVMLGSGDFDPVKMLESIKALEEDLYKKMPLNEYASTADTWKRQLIGLLYLVSKLEQGNCEDIESYNQMIDFLDKRFGNMENVSLFLHHYQQEQVKLC